MAGAGVGAVRTDAWSWGECKAIQDIGFSNSWSSLLCPPGLPVTKSHLLERTLQLALGHTVDPATLRNPSPPAELRAEAGPSSCRFPASPSSLCSLLSAQSGPGGPRRGPLLLLPLSSQSRGSYPKPLFRKPPWCSNLQAPPRRVRTGGHGSVERRQLRPESLSRWNQGPPRRQHPAPPPPPTLLPALLGPSRALRNSQACLCVRRSVRVSCGLGSHVRDRHRCREGEYTLVSSEFTKTAHPACTR